MKSLALVVLAIVSTRVAAPAQAPEASFATSTALLDELQAAWGARDAVRYLALWSFGDAEAREEETGFVSAAFSSGAAGLVVEQPSTSRGGRQRVAIRFVAIQEPRGRVEQHVLVIEARGGAWRIVKREAVGRIDGLVHLSLDPQGFRAGGLKIQLEDFELDMHSGTLFMAPENLGPTLAVFVGEGTVTFRPRPETEREQLRQFVGKPELKHTVKTAFLRIHPADLHKVLVPTRLEHDPEARGRYRAASAYFEEQSMRAFVLDAPLQGSPWWVLPGVGDSLVNFELGRHGTISFAVNADQPESISLFNRTKRQQICLYPRQGKTLRYSDDDAREVDILHHDLRLRFEPSTYEVAGEDSLSLRVLAPVTTVRLKLDDALQVESVTSAEAGHHLFFRVRHQDTLMVSLGGLAGTTPEVQLKIRFAGRLSPAPLEYEVLQLSPQLEQDEGPPIERVSVYSNRHAFYPQGPADDYATATLRIDVPAGLSAVTGGERLSARQVDGRTLVEYKQAQPGKYISIVVGRLLPVGERRVGNVIVTGYGLGRTRSEAVRSLDQAEDMLRVFSDMFGPCPYERVNLAVIEGRLPGGHSPPGMVVLARRPAFIRSALRDDPTNFSDVPGFFLAHELAHQWWGHGIASQNYRERWLSEGFAQYAALLWAQRAHGEEEFQDVLKRMGRWAIRKGNWGPVSLGYRLGHVKSEPEAFRALVYNKAAYVLHMLHGLVGREAFSAALRDLQARFRFAKAGTDDIREALEAASKQSLSAYFDQWIYGTSVPTLNLDHRVEATPARFRVVVEVEARDMPGPLPLELTVFHAGGRITERVMLPVGGGVFPLDSRERPLRVEVNADHALLAKVEGREPALPPAVPAALLLEIADLLPERAQGLLCLLHLLKLLAARGTVEALGQVVQGSLQRVHALLGLRDVVVRFLQPLPPGLLLLGAQVVGRLLRLRAGRGAGRGRRPAACRRGRLARRASRRRAEGPGPALAEIRLRIALALGGLAPLLLTSGGGRQVLGQRWDSAECESGRDGRADQATHERPPGTSGARDRDPLAPRFLLDGGNRGFGFLQLGQPVIEDLLQSPFAASELRDRGRIVQLELGIVHGLAHHRHGFGLLADPLLEVGLPLDADLVLRLLALAGSR